MAFQSMSFSAGETPTTAKWNQLNDNDDALRDGTGIANGAITEDHLADGLALPIGGVIMYWSDGGSLPTNFEICDGSAVSTSGSPINGETKPSLTNKFVRGVANQDLRTTPVSGGANSINIQHSHTVNNHTHSISFYAQRTGNITSVQPLVGGSGVPIDSHDHLISGNTGGSTPGTNNRLSSTQSILPAYVGLVYIMRVK